MNERRKPILLAIGLCVAVFLTIGIISAIQNRGKTSIEIVVAPEDAVITIDGKPIENGKHMVKNGKHTIAASRQYFGSESTVINTADIDPEITNSSSVYIILKPTTPEGRQYLADHPEVSEAMEGAGAGKADAEQAEIAKRFPIIADLPYETVEYRIDYGFRNNGQKIAFTVKMYIAAVVPGTEEYTIEYDRIKSDALTYLQDKGANITTADITYDAENSVEAE